jgi:hypothetical protein
MTGRDRGGFPRAPTGSVSPVGALIQVLRQAIAEGELAHLFTELPGDYAELRSGQPKSPASPSLAK